MTMELTYIGSQPYTEVEVVFNMTNKDEQLRVRLDDSYISMMEEIADELERESFTELTRSDIVRAAIKRLHHTVTEKKVKN